MVGKTCGNFMILAGNSSILDLTTLPVDWNFVVDFNLGGVLDQSDCGCLSAI